MPTTAITIPEFRDLDELEKFLCNVANSALELIRAIKDLNRNDGSHDGSDAEELDARIEALQRTVREGYEQLPGCLLFLELHIQRQRDNLHKVRDGQDQLNGSSTDNHLDEAQQQLHEEHKRAVKIHGLLQILIELIHRILTLTAQHGYGEPPPALVAPESETPPMNQNPVPTPSTDPELDDLTSLGHDQPTANSQAAVDDSAQRANTSHVL